MNPKPDASTQGPEQAASYTVRLPRRVLDRLKDRHAATFQHHRKSFNAYIAHKLERWSKPRAAAKQPGTKEYPHDTATR